VELADNLADLFHQPRLAQLGGLVSQPNISGSEGRALLGTKLLQIGRNETSALAGETNRNSRDLQ
jgi:hypothetical protein